MPLTRPWPRTPPPMSWAPLNCRQYVHTICIVTQLSQHCDSCSPLRSPKAAPIGIGLTDNSTEYSIASCKAPALHIAGIILSTGYEPTVPWTRRRGPPPPGAAPHPQPHPPQVRLPITQPWRTPPRCPLSPWMIIRRHPSSPQR
jgi:hypothetical protein